MDLVNVSLDSIDPNAEASISGGLRFASPEAYQDFLDSCDSSSAPGFLCGMLSPRPIRFGFGRKRNKRGKRK